MLVAIGVAAAAGASCRYLVDLAISHRTSSALPAGTLVINTVGAFALGVLVGIGLYHGLGDGPRLVLGTGFLGAYTTFSTFSYETFRLLEDRSLLEAALNTTASVGLGLAAAAAGLGLAGLL